jgi:hypothetical protein
MFGCVSWSGDGFENAVWSVLPDRTRACYFLPNVVVFRIADVQEFLDARKQLAALADQNAAFDFTVGLHPSLDTFGGQAYYQLPPNFHEIVS